jgi:hypothetical protein
VNAAQALLEAVPDLDVNYDGYFPIGSSVDLIETVGLA